MAKRKPQAVYVGNPPMTKITESDLDGWIEAAGKQLKLECERVLQDDGPHAGDDAQTFGRNVLAARTALEFLAKAEKARKAEKSHENIVLAMTTWFAIRARKAPIPKNLIGNVRQSKADRAMRQAECLSRYHEMLASKFPPPSKNAAIASLVAEGYGSTRTIKSYLRPDRFLEGLT